MRLDELSLKLRRRNGWESLDLGMAMCQHWRAPLLHAWLATYGIFVVLLSAVLWNYPQWVILTVWWLKPLFDRVLLFVLSRCIFGHVPTVRAVWRELPTLLRRTRLLAGLTFYRLSPSRSFHLPVWQLEGQRGRAARLRRQGLGLRSNGYAWGLMFFCTNFSMVLWFSGVVLSFMFIPDDMLPDGSFWWWQLFADDSQLWLAHFGNLLVFLAESLVEPVYVASGFSLYLNRRSELEGWDIEVTFRRMTQRVQEAHQRLTAHIGASVQAVLLALALCVGTWLTAPPAQAQETATENTSPAVAPEVQTEAQAEFSWPQGEIKRRIEAILKDPSKFGEKKTEWRWEYRKEPEKKDAQQQPSWLDKLYQGVSAFFDMLAIGGRVLIWLLVGVALVVAVYLVLRYQDRLPWQRGKRFIPEHMFGLDVRPESLPDDIGAGARTLLENGDITAALSLLYRAALSALIHHAAVEFAAGDTESQCWQRTRPVLSDAGLHYFRQLLDAWLLTAYAHRPPPLEQLHLLCAGWPGYFSADALVTAARRAA